MTSYHSQNSRVFHIVLLPLTIDLPNHCVDDALLTSHSHILVNDQSDPHRVIYLETQRKRWTFLVFSMRSSLQVQQAFGIDQFDVT